jgi:hypothetical protein
VSENARPQTNDMAKPGFCTHTNAHARTHRAWEREERVYIFLLIIYIYIYLRECVQKRNDIE